MVTYLHVSHALVFSRSAQFARRPLKHSRHTRHELSVLGTRSHFTMTGVLCVVQLLSGKNVSFSLSSDVVTVWQLKGAVKRLVGVPRRKQVLLEGGQELFNHNPINAHTGTFGVTLIIIEDKCKYCAAVIGNPCVCSGCRVTSYCAEACQRHDWRRHKSTCVPPWIGL